MDSNDSKKDSDELNFHVMKYFTYLDKDFIMKELEVNKVDAEQQFLGSEHVKIEEKNCLADLVKSKHREQGKGK